MQIGASPLRMQGCMGRIVYCRCAFAEVVPTDVKDAVLRGLCESGTGFETVPDICEMSARKDPKLAELAQGGPLKIAACYPRAVKWLLHAAGAGRPEVDSVQVMNMREEPAEQVLKALLEGEGNG